MSEFETEQARIAALAARTSLFLRQHGWTSLDAQSQKFLGCMMMLEDSPPILEEWEKRLPLVPLRAAISLWQENGRPNLGLLLDLLGSHPKADSIRRIDWVLLCEA